MCQRFTRRTDGFKAMPDCQPCRFHGRHILEV